MADYFTLIIHHGGGFVKDPKKRYVGGTVSELVNCDVDRFSLLTLNKEIGKFQYTDAMTYWYKIPGRDLDDGLSKLESDEDLMDFLMFLGPERTKLEMYIELHPLAPIMICDVAEFDDNVDKVNVGEQRANIDEVNEGTGEDSDYNGSDVGGDDDEALFEKEIDADAEWGGLETTHIADHPLGVRSFENVNCVDSDHGKSVSENDIDKEYSSDEDVVNSKIKYPQFNPKVDMQNIKFVEGLMFSNANEFRSALRDYAIKHGKEIRFTRNDSDRLRACCIQGCPWMIFVSQMQGENTLQVKSLMNVHTCSREFYSDLATSTWIASKYVQEIRAQPNIPVDVLKAKLQKEWHVCPGERQLYRARATARKWIEGCDTDQYGRLYDYLFEVKRTNPDTTAILVTRDIQNDKKVFQRLYLCLGGLKKGMRDGCRKIIGMDGAHLRGTHTGQVLVAIGLDGNNQTFPFAYAIVETENKEVWKWFLNLIKEDLGIDNMCQWTFLTDKQKGLIPALEEDFPGAEHRFCVWHMYNNFREKFKGLTLKGLFYGAASATHPMEFKRIMYEIQKTDNRAYLWLQERNPAYWSRAYYRIGQFSDIQINNICESLNGTIKGARADQILKLLETMRELLMKRTCVRRELIPSYSGIIYPNIQKIVEKNKIAASTMIPSQATEGLYQVDSTVCSGRWNVDLKDKTCGCRLWDLTGIPCSHAIAAIYHKRGKPETFVDERYTISSEINC